MPLVSQAMAGYTAKDFLRLPPITLLLVSILLAVLYRNWVGLVTPIVAVVTALVWTLGLMGWMGVPLSMMTMIVPVFLIAVGTAYCMHILTTYLDCARHTSSRRKAILHCYAQMTLPTVLAVATTVIGLSSLLVNRIKSIHEFALFAAFGILSLLVILLSSFPALLMLLPPVKPYRVTENRRGVFHRWLQWIVRINLQHRKLSLLGMGSVAIFCLAGTSLLSVETNPVGFFKANTVISQHFHDIYQDLSGSFPINVMMAADQRDYFEKPENIIRIEQLQNYLETLPGIDKSISFADYVKLVNYTLNEYALDAYRVPPKDFQVRMAINNFKPLLGEDMFARHMSTDLSKTNILLFTHLSSSKDFLSIRDAILAYVGSHFPATLTWDVTGFGMAVAASSHLLTRGQMKSFTLTMVLIFIIMLMLFLSLRVGIVAVLTNAFPILITFGIMGWAGIPISVVTSLIASIAIGLAVDDTIHYLYRYNYEFKKDLNKDRSMRDTLLHVGRPVIFTTLTIGIGFAVLLGSHFNPTSIFGLLILITLLTALIADLMLLPVLMLNVELVTAWDLLKLMPTLSGISAATTHELNQPLNAIKIGSEYLKMKLQQGKPIQPEHLARVVNEMDTQIVRAADIVRRLTAFGQDPGFARELTDVNQAVQHAVGMVANEFNIEDIALSVDLDASRPQVVAHPIKLSQVVFNLLSNAGESITAKRAAEPGAGNGLRIALRTCVQDQMVHIIVADTGIGIPAHLLKRVTEPFFSTKSSSQANGLGLTICEQILKAYGGKMEIESVVGQGARFKALIPLYSEGQL